MTTTWNPSDKDSKISLSNGNLTVTLTVGSGGYGAVRATSSHASTGKYYFEVTITSGADINIGVGTSSVSLTDYVGSSSTGWAIYGPPSTRVYNNGSNVGVSPNLGSGDVISVAVDLAASKIWFGRNGTWYNSGNPATGSSPIYSNLSGTLYPMCASHTDGGCVMTANFGATAFTYSAPSGFSAWDGSAISGDLSASDTADTVQINTTTFNPVSADIAFSEPQDTSTINVGVLDTNTGSILATESQDLTVISGTIIPPTNVGTIGEPNSGGTDTWDAAQHGSFTLSNGNLTGTITSFTPSMLISTLSKNTGKYYFEVTVTTDTGTTFPYIGLTDEYTVSASLGSGTGEYGYSNNGTLVHNGSSINSKPTWGVGDVISVALDFSSGKIWFAKNGSYLDGGDPASGTGATYSDLSGSIYAACTSFASGGTSGLTANFGATSFAYSIPSGFIAWGSTVIGGVVEPQDVAAFPAYNDVPNTVTLTVTEAQDTIFCTGGGETIGIPIIVAVGDSGSVSSSTDHGETWNTITTGFSTQLFDVTQCGDGGTWVVVGAGGKVYTNTDMSSSNFVARTYPNAFDINGVCFGNGTVVAVGAGTTSGDGKICYSTDDGSTWTSVFSASATLKKVYYANGLFVAVGNSGRIYTSSTGTSGWTQRTSPTATQGNLDVFYGNSTYVISKSGTTDSCLTSGDGSSWTARAMSPSTSIVGNSGFYGNGNYAIACNTGVMVTTATATSTWTRTVITWSGKSTTNDNLLGITYDGTNWVIVGGEGSSSLCLVSSDLSTYTPKSLSTSNIYRSVWTGKTPSIPYLIGNLSITEDSDTVTFSGNVELIGFGTLTAQEEADTVDISGAYVVDEVSIAMNIAEAPDTVDFQLLIVLADGNGDILATESPDSISISGVRQSASTIVHLVAYESPDTVIITGQSPAVVIMDMIETQDTVSITQLQEPLVTLTLKPETFDAMVTYGADLFNSGTLSLYTGSPPASVDDAPTGTLLAIVTLPADAFTDATDGSASKNGTWETTASDSGVAGWFRLADATGDNRIDGTVTSPAFNGNLIISNTSLNIGDPIVVNTVNFQFQLLDEE